MTENREGNEQWKEFHESMQYLSQLIGDPDISADFLGEGLLARMREQGRGTTSIKYNPIDMRISDVQYFEGRAKMSVMYVGGAKSYHWVAECRLMPVVQGSCETKKTIQHPRWFVQSYTRAGKS